MELSEDEIIEKYGKFVDIVIEIHYFHVNTSLLVFRVDST